MHMYGHSNWQKFDFCVYSYIHMFYFLIQYVHSFIICLYSIYRESMREKDIFNKAMHKYVRENQRRVLVVL